jgi:hypothetical protein
VFGRMDLIWVPLRQGDEFHCAFHTGYGLEKALRFVVWATSVGTQVLVCLDAWKKSGVCAQPKHIGLVSILDIIISI